MTVLGESVEQARTLFDDLHELSELSELGELAPSRDAPAPAASWAGELRRIVAGALVTVVVASVAVVALVVSGLAGAPHPARGPAASPVAVSGRVVAPGLAAPVSAATAEGIALRR